MFKSKDHLRVDDVTFKHFTRICVDKPFPSVDGQMLKNVIFFIIYNFATVHFSKFGWISVKFSCKAGFVLFGNLGGLGFFCFVLSLGRAGRGVTLLHLVCLVQNFMQLRCASNVLIEHI